jgi:hypothetical protein
MAGDIKFSHLVRQTSTTAGLGPLNLDGAPAAGTQGFVAGIGDGNITAYQISDASGNKEITWGTVTDALTDTISRGTLIWSTTGSRINFDSSEKVVAGVTLTDILLHVGQNPSLATANIASAAMTDIGSVFSFSVNITLSATAITSFGTQKKCLRIVTFPAGITLTHNATSLVLREKKDRVTSAGDIGIYKSDESGNWTELLYSYAVKPAFKAANIVAQSIATNTPTPVTFGTLLAGSSSEFSASRFHPTVPGWYRVRATVQAIETNTGAVINYFYGSFYKNGAEESVGFFLGNFSMGRQIVQSMNDLIYLNGTSDYLEVWATIFGSSPTFGCASNSARCFFSGEFSHS